MVGDRLEFELRLLPGVLAVGSDGDRLVITATSASAGGEAGRFAQTRMGDEMDVQVVARPTGGTSEEALLGSLREVPGVKRCVLRRAPSGAVREIRVTVRSTRAGDRTQTIVAAVLGRRFAEERLRITLEIPHLEDSSVPDEA